jgi:integrase
VPYSKDVGLAQQEQLTVRGIAALPIPSEEERQRDFKDGRVPGLVLRVFSSGRRSWYLRYRANGVLRKSKLGDYPALSLAAARKEAESLRVAVRKGADPVREKRAGREADTLGDLIDQYLEEHARVNLAPKSADEAERILRGGDFADLRKLPASDINDADVAKALDRIERRGAMTMLNRSQSALSAVYTWASPRRRGGVVSNPLRGLPRRYSEGGREKRFLSLEELRTVFASVDSLDSVPEWAAVALWGVLGTGQRPGEVLQARWEHIDLSNGKWEMPLGYRKRVRGQRDAPAHDVPLSPLVVRAFRRLETNRRGYVFAAATKSGHKGTNHLNQRVQRGLLKDLNEHSEVVAPFTPHDLRRTCSTHLHRMGVPRHIVERTLGHVDSSVAGVYDRHAYWRERRDALNEWSSQLESEQSGNT